jgi:hypothetical protein
VEAALDMSTASRILVALLLVSAVSAQAQVAVSAYGGYLGSSGIDNAGSGEPAELTSAGAFLLAIGTDMDASRELQLQFAQQSTTLSPGGGAAPFDLTVRYLHVGGTAYVDRPIGPGPYAVGGLGATQFSPSTAGFGSEWKPSLNVGFGWAWPLSSNVLLRAEARAFLTFVDSSGGFLCSGGCVVVLRSDVFTQYGALLGLTARF